ncbi:hypothetical protein [Pseudoflavitalea rhizosphaerae]|uniref:hypothetical protein n=1 Tax=Pseudoflavitalea rhizosphaerae TaxID=1884793 RepID=UPI0013DFA8B0|nr:hypothetical protein [Pseudoflavitalea rhizosphaerae]
MFQAAIHDHIPLQTWSHLVAQSTDFTAAEWTVYLDGKKLTLSNSTSAPAYPFSWEIAPGPTVPEDDLE